MPALNLSASTRAGIAIIRDLQQSTFDTLAADLERSLESIQANQKLSPEKAQLLKDTVEMLYAVRAYNDVPLNEFINDILESLEFHKEIAPSAIEPMRSKLARILDVSALRVAAKAALLHQEHERTFCTARIFTDVRPIYDNGAKVPPSGAIITHTLKISYHESEGGEIHDIFVAMGSDDIRELQDVLNRATDKAVSLRGVLEVSKLRYIDPQL